MKLWGLKYFVKDKTEAIKDYLTDDTAILVYRVVVIALVCGVVVLVINMKYG